MAFLPTILCQCIQLALFTFSKILTISLSLSNFFVYLFRAALYKLYLEPCTISFSLVSKNICPTGGLVAYSSPPPDVGGTFNNSQLEDKGWWEEQTNGILVSMLENFLSSSLTTRPNKRECLHPAKTFHSGLTFAGSTRSLPMKEAYERTSNWVGSGLALKF